MEQKDKTTELFQTLVKKAALKQLVYSHTIEALKMLKTGMKDLSERYTKMKFDEPTEIPFTYRDRNEFEAELRFGGDTLVFMMHTNIFEIPRDHEVMKTPYIREDKDRSYCGIINIFNFLSDSFKYNRLNDIGYLIGRLLINKDMHYFVEGKREIGFLFSSFGNSLLDKKSALTILESAISYTINFDLLTPPYDNVKLVTVQEFMTEVGTMQIKTGKRLGFKFQADLE